MTVNSLGYVVVATQKREEWHRFLTEVVGAMPGRPQKDGVALYRVDGRPFRFWIEPGETEQLVASAFEVSDAASLAQLADAVASAGRPVRHATDEEARARGVDQMFATSDPAGNGLEFFCGTREDGEPFLSPAGVAGFVTGEMGMGHSVLPAPDYEASHVFYRDVLGFGDTDLPRFYLQGGDSDPGMGFAFMHGGGGRHHAVALAECPAPPSRCIHLMLEMQTLIDVGRCHDRMRAAGIPESATLGRHVNDEMTGFYMQTPSGFDLEIGCDGLVIDPASWAPTAHQQISVWGHVWAWQKAATE